MTRTSFELLAFEQLAYAYGEPQAKALLKQEPEDFCVEEVLGFDFTDSGEHVCLQIEKTNITTTDLAKKIAETFNVPSQDIGYAGMKDRRAICTQWYSIKKPKHGSLNPAQLNDQAVQVLASRENARKIRIGSHRANRFRIRLRAMQDPLAEIPSRLHNLALSGAPNYFGQQRLGRQNSNIHAALEFFAGLLPDQRPKARRALKQGMWVSASRGYLFNLILSRRVVEQSWNTLLEGEVMALEGSGRLFIPEQSQSLQKILFNRLSELDIHPTGLLAGKIDAKDKYQASAKVLRLEQELLESCPELLAGLLTLQVKATRRPLRTAVQELVSQQRDSGILELNFLLNTGSYATSVLRELCKTIEPQ